MNRTHRLSLAILWVIICVASSFLIQRQAMEPTANLVQYLPLMQKVHNPALFPVDDWVPLLVRRVPGLFWPLLGIFVPPADPYPWLFALNLLTRLGSAALLYLLATRVSGDWRAGLIAVFLLSGQVDTVLGRGDINWSYFTHTAASIPLIVLVYYLIVRKWTPAAFAVAGLLANIHILNAFYLCTLLGFYLILQYRTLGIKKIAGLVLLSFVFASPVFPTVFRSLSVPAGGDLWTSHALAYHRLLLSPFTQPVSAWIRFAGYFILFIHFCLREKDTRCRLLGFSAISMWTLLYLLALLFTSIHPVALMLKLQPARCTDLFILLFFVFFARDVLQGLLAPTVTGKTLHAMLLWLVYIFNLRYQPGPILTALSVLWLLLCGLKICRDRSGSVSWNTGRLFRAGVWGWGLLGLFLGFLLNRFIVQWLPLRAFFLVRPSSLVALGVVFPLVAWLFCGRRSERAPSRQVLKRTAIVILLLLGIEFAQRTTLIAAHSFRITGHLLFDRFNPAFFDTARWCQENTPVDALIICPPYRGGFRGESLRSVFVSWDEQIALWVAPDYLPEYVHRLDLLDYEAYQPGQNWLPSPENIRRIRQEYGADFLVVPIHLPMPFRLVYANKLYCVYALNPST